MTSQNFFLKNKKWKFFFDDGGIEKCLSQYTEKEVKKLNIINKNFEKYQLKYYKTIDKEVKRILNLDFFLIKSHEIPSEGKTTFVVDKTQSIHNCHISELIGELTHIAEKPRSMAINFISYFEKTKSPSDKISVGLVPISYAVYR